MADLHPEGALETFQAERVVAAAWRLLRAERVEASVLTWEVYEAELDRAQRAADACRATPVGTIVEYIDRPVVDREGHAAAVSHAESVARKRDIEVSLLSRAFRKVVGVGGPLTDIERYETALGRAFTRALEELRRTQQFRSSGSAPNLGPAIRDSDGAGASEPEPDTP